MLWDPFFGVFDFGKSVARWLNRLLIIAEIAAAVWGFKYHCEEVWLRSETIWRILYFPGCLIAVNVLNRAIRILWNIFLVFIFGSSDPEEIYARHEDRVARREERNKNVNLRREKAELKRQENERKRREINKKEFDYYMHASPADLMRENACRRIGRRFLYRLLLRNFSSKLRQNVAVFS